jgi:DNA-binding transcriptional LysR family regulator
MSLKLQQLRIFVAIFEEGGVGQAADRLRIAQPSVSVGLKGLERSLGQPLFERPGGARRIVPTARALRFYHQAIDILRRCEDAEADHVGEVKPSLRIGVMSTLAARDVGAAVAALKRSEPGVQIWEGRPSRLAELLRQGRLDIAWTSVEAGARNTRVLWQEPFAVFASLDHKFAKGGKRSLSQLKDEQIVLRLSCEMKPGTLRALGLTLPRAARAERDDVAMQLVAQGAGIAIAPLSLATSEVSVLAVRDLDLSRTVGLRWRADLAERHIDDVSAAIVQAVGARHVLTRGN